MSGFWFVVGADLVNKGVDEHMVRKHLHDDAQTLVDLEVYNVSSRTPVLTGALQADVSGEADTDESSDEIAHIYSDESNQLDEYGRVYVEYQEGGELGAGSNNGSGDHEMYFQVTTTDIPDIEAWALAAVQGGLDAMFGAKE